MKEALKMALEALEKSMYPQQTQLKAIAAIKEALREHAMYEVQRLGQEIQPEPPQRTWVGLTDEQKLSLEIQGGKADVMLAELVEQWLKEKNT